MRYQGNKAKEKYISLLLNATHQATGPNNSPPSGGLLARGGVRRVLQYSDESSGTRQRLCSRLLSEIHSTFGAKRQLNLWPAALKFHMCSDDSAFCRGATVFNRNLQLQPLTSSQTTKAKAEPVNLAQVEKLGQLLLEFFFPSHFRLLTKT